MKHGVALARSPSISPGLPEATCTQLHSESAWLSQVYCFLLYISEGRIQCAVQSVAI